MKILMVTSSYPKFPGDVTAPFVDAPFAVAVDTDPVHCDGEEATKVRVVSGAVVDVGHRLAVWDAVDAGIFLCDRSVAETAEHARFGRDDRRHAEAITGLIVDLLAATQVQEADA